MVLLCLNFRNLSKIRFYIHDSRFIYKMHIYIFDVNHKDRSPGTFKTRISELSTS